MKKGKIICLNGVSSAGKTSLSKILQERLSEPYYWLSEDVFAEMTPQKISSDESVENEALWYQTYINMYHTIKLYSEMGHNVIVDGVLDENYPLLQMVEILNDNPVLFVHVTCPVEELSRREKSRGDREVGLAKKQLSYLCPQDEIYDVTVDTHQNTTEACADKIINLLDTPDNFQAFKILWRERARYM